MFTQLIFSETVRNALKGTLRAVISVSFMIVIGIVWYMFIARKFYEKYMTYPKPSFRSIFPLILAVGLIASAISVQLPKSLGEAVIYGSLVGLVTYSVLNLVVLSVYKRWSWITALVDVIYGIIVTGLASLFLYFIFFRGRKK